MPKIRITEIDNTGGVQYDDSGNSVFILGPAASAASLPQEAIVLSRVSELDSNESISKTYDNGTDDEHDSVSYLAAKALLGLGVGVVYKLLDAEDIKANSEGALSAIKEAEDRTKYDVRFIFLGDFADASNYPTGQDDLKKAYAQAWQSAAKRGDCIALLDAPKDVAAVAGMRTFIDGVATSVGAEFGGSGEYAGIKNGETFAAAFAPWLKLRLDATDVEAPGSLGYLLAFAHSVRSNPVWYSAAGTFRGVIPELVEPAVRLSNADCEILQARAADAEVGLGDEDDNVGRAINPIALVNPYGYVVWGNRTLRDNKAEENGSLPATAFLNVRVLATELSKTVYRAARRYTFEQNSNVLWANFKSMVVPLLDRMQSGNGINGYRIARLASDRRGLLKARITIIPIEAVEDFDIEITMENSIAEVTE